MVATVCVSCFWIVGLSAPAVGQTSRTGEPVEPILTPSLAYLHSSVRLRVSVDTALESVAVPTLDGDDRRAAVHGALGVRWRPGGKWMLGARLHIVRPLGDETTVALGHPGISLTRAWRYPAKLAPGLWAPLFRTAGLVEAHLAVGVDLTGPWNSGANQPAIRETLDRARFGDDHFFVHDAWLLRVNLDYRHDIFLCRNLSWQVHLAPVVVDWQQLAVEWAGSLGWQVFPGYLSIVGGYRGTAHVAGERRDLTLPDDPRHILSGALDFGSTGWLRIYGFVRPRLDNAGFGISLRLPLAREAGR